MSDQPVMVPGRIILVGNAERMPLPAGSDMEQYRRCERCGKDDAVILSKYQAAKADEINRTYDWAPVTAGGKYRPPCGLFCWHCATKLGIKSRGIPIPKEKLNHV